MTNPWIILDDSQRERVAAAFGGFADVLAPFLAEFEEALPEGVQPLSDGAREKLLDLLAALGDNPDQVAVSLATRQCLGSVGDAIGCPVYRYLEDVLGAGDLEVLAVGADGIAVTEDGGMSSSNLVPPECVADFIDRFDQHDYPELIKP